MPNTNQVGMPMLSLFVVVDKKVDNMGNRTPPSIGLPYLPDSIIPGVSSPHELFNSVLNELSPVVLLLDTISLIAFLMSFKILGWLPSTNSELVLLPEFS
jgi:hypothetical protein